MTIEIDEEDIVIPAAGEKPTDPSDSEKPSKSEKQVESSKPEGTSSGSDTGEGTVNTNHVQTGESNDVALWISLFVVAGGALMSTALCIRKRKYNH